MCLRVLRSQRLSKLQLPVFSSQDDAELAEVKQEEQEAIEQAAGLAEKEDLNVESDFTEEIMEIAQE